MATLMILERGGRTAQVLVTGPAIADDILRQWEPRGARQLDRRETPGLPLHGYEAQQVLEMSL